MSDPESIERLGHNRIPAESGNAGLESQIVICDLDSDTRGDIDLGIMNCGPDDGVGLGLAYHDQPIESFSMFGEFAVEDAREIASMIDAICDRIEEREDR
jgi:hypothetical protein